MVAMSTRIIRCDDIRNVEHIISRLQERMTHVEFVSYKNRKLTIAYIARKEPDSTINVFVRLSIL